MKTRQLFSWELDDLECIAKAFHAEAGLGGVFSEVNWRNHIATLYRANSLGAFGVFDGDNLVGALVGQISSHTMTDEIIASELFWYILPTNRGGTYGIRLLDEFESWAKAAGATIIIMANLAQGADKLERLYVKRGYKQIETHHLKWLSQPQQ